ncbi:DNA-directed RNA polymerase sigma-70 factor [Sphaerisporangium rufum]|uniref:DNA-directed RNA polymerase sigma-70 factor n=1 Tax=Sphaerisporangium rufum TaxID=1381558 RepID=A0A919R6K6_9ACTN|nr:sigma-70 family RNA polymerase sigma factor [Sphaerisporangium rufum]GII80574.1 DNA-directed RNA polymerase sigma-70 factor [Sphaerisporangium rufum]
MDGPDKTDDRVLHQRVVGGDEAALGELHDRLYPLVLALALRVTRDRSVAEDIVQEVFVTFWQRPLSFDPDRGTLRSWLATIAHRRAVDHVRTEERHRTARAPLLPEPAAGPPEEGVLAADEAARVRRAVSRLPGEVRQAIELAYYGGRTYRQAAEELGLPEGTVKSRIRLGLRKIADELSEEEV